VSKQAGILVSASITTNGDERDRTANPRLAKFARVHAENLNFSESFDTLPRLSGARNHFTALRSLHAISVFSARQSGNYRVVVASKI
jgi:hypothetical protein